MGFGGGASAVAGFLEAESVFAATKLLPLGCGPVYLVGCRGFGVVYRIVFYGVKVGVQFAVLRSFGSG